MGAKFVFHTDCTAGPLLCQWECEQARTKLPTADMVFSLYNHHFSSNTNIGPFLCHRSAIYLGFNHLIIKLSNQLPFYLVKRKLVR